MKIILYGRVPSKKNSKRMIQRGKKRFLVPSEAHEVWHEAQMYFLNTLKIPLIKRIKYIEIIFYAPDKRSADLSNKTESCMDLLVDAGIIEDDNWFVVGELRLKLGGVDRKNPRVEIEICH